jgi:fucose permease
MHDPSRAKAGASGDPRLIKALTFLMFTMFAMTTDSVGAIIPRIIAQFHLGMTAGGAFQYATQAGVALAAIGLGFLADALGRKTTIILGLAVFATASLLFAVGDQFGFFLVLLFVSGAAIGVFKTGALALIGDISTSTAEHTTTMNLIEGFFGVGAIIGPLVVARLLLSGASWKWLYVIAGGICVVLIIGALLARYPRRAVRVAAPKADAAGALAMIGEPYALAFSLGVMFYVGVESAIYVWMPTFLAGYRGGLVAIVPYALPIFFVLRAGGRFLGSWMLARLKWTVVLALCGLGILVCFAGALGLGHDAAVLLLPLSGLFMSVMYPTLNSKGISCFPRAQHGAVAGVILFFTCISAVLSPLGIGLLGDAFHSPRAGFGLAVVFAALLFGGLAFNWIKDPTRGRLSGLDLSEYDLADPSLG